MSRSTASVASYSGKDGFHCLSPAFQLPVSALGRQVHPFRPEDPEMKRCKLNPRSQGIGWVNLSRQCKVAALHLSSHKKPTECICQTHGFIVISLRIQFKEHEQNIPPEPHAETQGTLQNTTRIPLSGSHQCYHPFSNFAQQAPS